MVINKKPFVAYKDEKDRKDKYGRPFTVRLNAKEQAELNMFKAAADIKQDGTALKVLAHVGYIVLHSTLGHATLRWLFKKERVRWTDYEDTEKYFYGKL